MGMNSPTTLLDLPPELLQLSFCLGSGRAAVQAMQTCKSLSKLNQETLWQSLCVACGADDGSVPEKSWRARYIAAATCKHRFVWQREPDSKLVYVDPAAGEVRTACKCQECKREFTVIIRASYSDDAVAVWGHGEDWLDVITTLRFEAVSSSSVESMDTWKETTHDEFSVWR